MKEDEQMNAKKKDIGIVNLGKEPILLSYDCKKSCRECPFPGAKCNQHDRANVKNIIE